MIDEDGRLLSVEASHEEWQKLLVSQSRWEGPIDQEASSELKAILAQAQRQARNDRGHGQHDADVYQDAVVSIVNEWKESDALPPDLLPRAPFKCGHQRWNVVVWLLIRLTGPACLALRPRLWRAAAMVALYKRGDALRHASFRLIMVKAQMGLIQEGLLSTRLTPSVRGAISDYQGGYERGVEDAHLLFHELSADAMASLRCLWVLLGDFKGAFPRTRRADLQSILLTEVGLHGGAFALLASVFQSDTVTVRYSGDSTVNIEEGVPEGSTMGTLTYVALPDTLIKELEAAGHGVGVGVCVPAPWQGYKWSGVGTPQAALVANIKKAISSGSDIPGTALLAAWPDLEASALKAMDLLAPRRLVAIFQADDPLLLATSRGELQAMAQILGDWATRHHAVFHTGAAKSVVLRIHEDMEACGASSAAVPINLQPTAGQWSELTYAQSEKWLGLSWPANLIFTQTLHERLRMASGSFAILAGMVEDKSIPLPLAIALFEGKIEGFMQFGRWLLATAKGAADILDTQYEIWARALLGAQAWRNGAIVQLELGWALSGMGRAVKSIVMKRTSVLSASPDDVVRSTCEMLNSERSWLQKSAGFMAAWELQDFAVMKHQQRHIMSLDQYRRHAHLHIAEQCHNGRLDKLSRHRAHLKYTRYQQGPSYALREAHRTGLPWEILVATRSWSRVRIGVPYLSHRHGRRSAAKEQACVFCGRFSRIAIVHCFGRCTYWAARRAAFTRAAGLLDEVDPIIATLAVLAASLTQPAVFVAAVLWAEAVDKEAEQWWHEHKV